MGKIEFTESSYYEVTVTTNQKLVVHKIVDRIMEIKGFSILFTNYDGVITHHFPSSITIVKLVEI